MIIRGELKYGKRLPSERELAERFHVSRGSLREGIKVLEYLGVLDSAPGSGTYVKHVTLMDVLYKADISASVSAASFQELMEMRVFLESFAAYSAALRCTSQEMDRIFQTGLDLRQAKKRLLCGREDIQNVQRISRQFYREIVSASHNSVLLLLYEKLYELQDVFRQFLICSSGISYDSMLAREAIFHKIAARDADGAREAMESHLKGTQHRVKSILSGIEAAEIANCDLAGRFFKLLTQKQAEDE